MKSIVIVALAASISATQEGISDMSSCEKTFMTIFDAKFYNNDGIRQCAKDSGLSFDITQVPTEEALDKAIASPSCTLWFDDFTSTIKAISPPCTFEDDYLSSINTATFDWTIKDLFPFRENSKYTVCKNKMVGILRSCVETDEAMQCVKDSGVQVVRTMVPSEVELAKLHTTASCTSWWTGTVRKVNAISPSCGIQYGNGGPMVSSSKFNWTLGLYYERTKDRYTPPSSTPPANLRSTTATPPTDFKTTTAQPSLEVRTTTTAKPDSFVTEAPAGTTVQPDTTTGVTTTGVPTTVPATKVASSSAIKTASAAAIVVTLASMLL